MTGRSRSQSRSMRTRDPQTLQPSQHDEDPTPSQQGSIDAELGTQTETHLHSQSQAFHSASQTQTRLPGTFESKSVAQEEAPRFQDEGEAQHSHELEYEHEHDHVDNKLPNITKDFELNINKLVTDVLRAKSRQRIDELPQENKKGMKDNELQAVSLSCIVRSVIGIVTKLMCCYKLQTLSCKCLSVLTIIRCIMITMVVSRVSLYSGVYFASCFLPTCVFIGSA
jgi:hypothetical protein